MLMLLSANIFLLLLILSSYSIYFFSSTFKYRRVHYYDVRLILAGERENHLVNPPINDQIQFLINQDDTTLKILIHDCNFYDMFVQLCYWCFCFIFFCYLATQVMINLMWKELSQVTITKIERVINYECVSCNNKNM